MSTATWVIQSNKIQTRQTLPLINALKELDEPFVDVGVDHLGPLHPVDPSLGVDLIPYGSVSLMKTAQQNGWKHFYHDDTTFRVDTWIQRHPGMLNMDARILTLKEAAAIAHGRPEWFIRPVHDFKAFAGEVMTADALVAWVDNLDKNDCEFDSSLLVALSIPKPIVMEWRYFIVDGRIVTGSSYRYEGRPHRFEERDSSVLDEAQALADYWLPHPCCVMDVGLVDGQPIPQIVEFNGINASGFYAHDVRAFAKALSDYARSH